MPLDLYQMHHRPAGESFQAYHAFAPRTTDTRGLLTAWLPLFPTHGPSQLEGRPQWRQSGFIAQYTAQARTKGLFTNAALSRLQWLKSPLWLEYLQLRVRRLYRSAATGEGRPGGLFAAIASTIRSGIYRSAGLHGGSLIVTATHRAAGAKQYGATARVGGPYSRKGAAKHSKYGKSKWIALSTQWVPGMRPIRPAQYGDLTWVPPARKSSNYGGTLNLIKRYTEGGNPVPGMAVFALFKRVNVPVHRSRQYGIRGWLPPPWAVTDVIRGAIHAFLKQPRGGR